MSPPNKLSSDHPSADAERWGGSCGHSTIATINCSGSGEAAPKKSKSPFCTIGARSRAFKLLILTPVSAPLAAQCGDPVLDTIKEACRQLTKVSSQRAIEARYGSGLPGVAPRAFNLALFPHSLGILRVGNLGSLAMDRFIHGEDRMQQTLLPHSLEVPWPAN